MSKRKRIEELERRVAELEARPVVYPSVPSVWADIPCATCGYYGAHACLVPGWNTPTASIGANTTYIGAN